MFCVPASGFRYIILRNQLVINQITLFARVVLRDLWMPLLVASNAGLNCSAKTFFNQFAGNCIDCMIMFDHAAFARPVLNVRSLVRRAGMPV